MSELEFANIHVHEDAALFREALNFTAAQTTFLARLIEKDYFCTVILKYLADALGDACIFKGGTCLAKVHVGFYRLSEDLDFTLPMPVNAGRRERSQKAACVKRAFAAIPDRLPGLKIVEPLRGANDSAQWRFNTWVFTIAHRLAISRKRRRRWFRIGFDPDQQTASALPSVAMQEEEWHSKLWNDVRRILNDDAFTAVWFTYVESMPAADVGKILGRSANGVRLLLHRARKQLVEQLPGGSDEL